MTPKQLETLKSLARYRQEHGRMPSFRELAKELGVAVRTVQKSIGHLQRAGAIRVTGARGGFSIEPPGLHALRDEYLNEW